VLDNQVIYVFVCGKGGRNVWVQKGEQLRRRGLTEKIDRVQLADQFKIGVREAKRLGVPLNSLWLHCAVSFNAKSSFRRNIGQGQFQ